MPGFRNIIRLGSCPECGGKIYSNNQIEENQYKCLKCKWIGTKEQLIPF